MMRSVVTGEVASWGPSQQLVLPSWRRLKPRNWLPSLAENADPVCFV
uniref:Uncharacterized protein n=1 Tax=Anguilla anguilla TaxID=7936 RepID=A0A0E9U0Q8_ANGAN